MPADPWLPRQEDYANPLKYKLCPKMRGGLVADLLEIFAQLDDRVEGVGRLDRVGVVSDEERLCGLVGDDAFLALACVSIAAALMVNVSVGAPSSP
jgi:hypothetical protein